MKRFLAYLMTLVLVLSMLPLAMSAKAAEVLDSGKYGDNVTWTMYDDGRLVFSGTGAIMDSNEYTVHRWTNYVKQIKHIVFEEGITYIGHYILRSSLDYIRLESVSIPSTVNKIGQYVFDNLSGYVDSVYISDLQKWCAIEFTDSTSNPLACNADLYLNGVRVEYLKIPESVTNIHNFAFCGCTSIRTLEISENVKSIGAFSFSACHNLEKVIFRGNAPAFGSYPFSISSAYAYYPSGNSTWSSDVMLPYDGPVTWVPYNPATDDVASDAFSGDPSGGYVTWRMDEATGTLTISGSGAMKDYASGGNTPWYDFLGKITSIVVEEGVTTIGNRAFSGLWEVKTVSLPSTLTSIGSSAFSSCHGIAHLVVPPKVSFIGGQAFDGCNSLKKLVFLGDAPSAGNCLRNCRTTVYYPADNPTWTEFAKIIVGEDYTTWIAEVHNYISKDAYDICTYSGNVRYTCSSCEHSYSEYITAPGHNYENGFCTICGVEKPPFDDIVHGVYYYDAVKWAVEKEITTGTSATNFSPDMACSRGQVVTFLWRAAGSPAPAAENNPFTDVEAGAYYYDAVLWAVEQGITTGTSATTFNPNMDCSRGQIVTFLHRAQGKPESSGNNSFSDLVEGAYYFDAVLWAVENGVTQGTGEGKFSPDAVCTRSQIVTFLYRAMV